MAILDEGYQVPRWGASTCQLSAQSSTTPAAPPDGRKSFPINDARDVSKSTWDFEQGFTGKISMKPDGKSAAIQQNQVTYRPDEQHAPPQPSPFARHSCPSKMGIDPATIEGLQEVWEKVYNPISGRGLTFPETVNSLADLGVNRYRVDFITSTATAYIGGDACVYHFPPYATEKIVPGKIPWSLEMLRTAIKKAREDARNNRPDLPNYTLMIIEAGVVDYTCFIEGRRVTYAGYLGEMYSAWFMGSGADSPLNTGSAALLARRNTLR